MTADACTRDSFYSRARRWLERQRIDARSFGVPWFHRSNRQSERPPDAAVADRPPIRPWSKKASLEKFIKTALGNQPRWHLRATYGGLLARCIQLGLNR